jgi:hypothetical protein
MSQAFRCDAQVQGSPRSGQMGKCFAAEGPDAVADLRQVTKKERQRAAQRAAGNCDDYGLKNEVRV